MPHVVAGLLMSLTRGQSPKDVSDDQIDAVLRDFRDRGQRVPGIGHPVHRGETRGPHALRRVAKENDCYDGNVALMDRVVDRFAVMTGRGSSERRRHPGGRPPRLRLDSDQIFGLTILILTPSLVAHAIEEIDQGNVMRIIPADQVGTTTPTILRRPHEREHSRFPGPAHGGPAATDRVDLPGRRRLVPGAAYVTYVRSGMAHAEITELDSRRPWA